MVDYVADLKQRPFILAGRTVETIQLQVIGCIKDHVRIGTRGCDVRSDGSVVVNLTPDMAQALAKELLTLARKSRYIHLEEKQP